MNPAPTWSRREWLAHCALGLGALAVPNLTGRARPLGIFTHLVPGTHREKAKLIRAAGLTCVQWYPALDHDPLTPAVFRRVAADYASEGLPIAAFAGYVNLFDPRPELRKQLRDQLSLNLRLAPECGCPYVCTETGTLNPLRVWHPDNLKPEIWNQFVDLIGQYCVEAKRAGTYLVLEAYTKNICRDPHDLKRLQQALGYPSNLRFVADACNIVYESDLPNQHPALDRFFETIRTRCVVAHAKDVIFVAGDKVTPGAGAGKFDWDYFAERLVKDLPTTPLILEHLDWKDLTQTLGFVRRKLARAQSAVSK